MAKITRVFLAPFGADGPTDDFAEFGSQTAGTPLKTKDVAVIQSLDAWNNGWKDAIIAANKAPFLEDMNALFYVHSYMMAYVLQEGVAEWDNNTTYYIGSIVKKVGTTELYGSKTDNNVSNTLPVQVDDANWTFLGTRLVAYRRPRLAWNSGSTIDVEAQTGTANQTTVMFPDGSIRTVTEDLSSTQKYRRMDRTLTANWTSGTESGGLRPGLAFTINTWYAIYLVKSQIDATKFVMVGDTTLPLQANVGTLNGRYGTNGWAYMGMVRAGLKLLGSEVAGSTTETDFVKFIQMGHKFSFTVYTTNYPGPTPVNEEGQIFLNLVSVTTAQSSNTIYNYSAGVGPTQIPDHLTFVNYRLIQGKNPPGAATWGNIRVQPADAGLDDPICHITGLFPNQFFAGGDFFWPAARGMAVSKEGAGNWPETASFRVALKGWEDSVLADGLNNLI